MASIITLKFFSHLNKLFSSTSLHFCYVGGPAEMFSSLVNRDARHQWENFFNKTYIQPVLEVHTYMYISLFSFTYRLACLGALSSFLFLSLSVSFSHSFCLLVHFKSFHILYPEGRCQYFKCYGSHFQIRPSW